MKEEQITTFDAKPHPDAKKQGRKLKNRCPSHIDEKLAEKISSNGDSTCQPDHREEKRKVTIRMQSLEEDNHRLRERVAHVENLGILVADSEQQKIDLLEENLALRKKLEILEKSFGQRTKQTPATDEESASAAYTPEPIQPSLVQPDVSSAADGPIQVNTGSGKTNQISKEHFVDDANDDDVMRVASLFLSQAAAVSFGNPAQHWKEKSPKKKQGVLLQCVKSQGEEEAVQVETAQSNKGKKTDSIKADEPALLVKENVNTDDKGNAGANKTPPQLKQGTSSDRVRDQVADGGAGENGDADEETFNQQIEQLEEMIGLQRETTDVFDSPSVNEMSMTFQFTKIAGVFASLAQHVVKSQRQARNSQAYSDALVSENKKLKRELQECKQQLEHIKMVQSDSSAPPIATQTSGALHNSDDGPMVSKLQARVKKLEKQRAEILQVNKSWDTQYRRLKEELEKRSAPSPLDAASKLTDLPGTSKEVPRRRDAEGDASDAHKKSSPSRHLSTKQIQALKHEMARFKDRAAKLESEKGCLKAENARLNQALEATYRLASNMKVFSVYERRSLPRQDRNEMPAYATDQPEHPEPAVIEELRTHIEVLQEQVMRWTARPQYRHQQLLDQVLRLEGDRDGMHDVMMCMVKIYREDFETERKDRERNQNEKQRLQEALARSRREVHALAQQARTHEADFQRERRDKEKAQRQLRLCQRSQTGARRRDRYYADAAEPPAYQGHRRLDGASQNYAAPTGSSRRRSRAPHHLYDATSPHAWMTGDSTDEDNLPQSPDDELDLMF